MWPAWARVGHARGQESFHLGLRGRVRQYLWRVASGCSTRGASLVSRSSSSSETEEESQFDPRGLQDSFQNMRIQSCVLPAPWYILSMRWMSVATRASGGCRSARPGAPAETAAGWRGPGAAMQEDPTRTCAFPTLPFFAC
ncbi:unnamed protein product, partial [Prorocentrum cordatum]